MKRDARSVIRLIRAKWLDLGPQGERVETDGLTLHRLPDGEQLVNVEHQPRGMADEEDQNVTHEYCGWNGGEIVFLCHEWVMPHNVSSSSPKWSSMSLLLACAFATSFGGCLGLLVDVVVWNINFHLLDFVPGLICNENPGSSPELAQFNLVMRTWTCIPHPSWMVQRRPRSGGTWTCGWIPPASHDNVVGYCCRSSKKRRHKFQHIPLMFVLQKFWRMRKHIREIL